MRQTNTVFYFGEDVDIYEAGEIVSHDGAWRAGTRGARVGVMMPSLPLLGLRYYQEIAPGVAMDRVEIMSMTEVSKTPAGVFSHCLKVGETTPLEPKVKDHKFYALGIGLVQDGEFVLKKYGYR